MKSSFIVEMFVFVLTYTIYTQWKKRNEVNTYQINEESTLIQGKQLIASMYAFVIPMKENYQINERNTLIQRTQLIGSMYAFDVTMSENCHRSVIMLKSHELQYWQTRLGQSIFNTPTFKKKKTKANRSRSNYFQTKIVNVIDDISTLHHQLCFFLFLPDTTI